MCIGERSMCIAWPLVLHERIVQRAMAWLKHISLHGEWGAWGGFRAGGCAGLALCPSPAWPWLCCPQLSCPTLAMPHTLLCLVLPLPVTRVVEVLQAFPGYGLHIIGHSMVSGTAAAQLLALACSGATR